MKCPFCGFEDTQVKDSRPSEDGSAIRRRRFCGKCNSRFTTFERVHLRELVVVKKSGERRMFDRDKVLRSLEIALRKRPVKADVIEQVATRIVQKLEASGESEVQSAQVGQLVMEELRALDKVAYIRFASVYKAFSEAKEFEAIVDELGKHH